MADVPIDRCVTGIRGFDALCKGGFVQDSDNVIIGGPGSGKTTFLLQFLYNGATVFNENGLYCSFEPDIIETLKDGMAHSWDFAKLNEENRVKFLKFSPHTAVDQLKSEMLRLVSRYQIKRICFDPISVLALHLGDVGKVRETIFEISSLMKRLKVTSVMADETFEEQDLLGSGPSNNYAKTDIIRFLSDSVIMFLDSKMALKGERSLKVVKMRRTNHLRDFIGMDINNSGIVVYAENSTNYFDKNRPLQINSGLPQEKNLPQNIPTIPSPSSQLDLPKSGQIGLQNQLNPYSLSKDNQGLNNQPITEDAVIVRNPQIV